MPTTAKSLLEFKPKTMENAAETLREVLERHRGEQHAVVVQDYPDPDALSSAFAHRLIAAGFDISVDIIYGGKISHYQNVALVRLLGIPLVSFSAEVDLSEYKGYVLVDSQGTNSSVAPRLAQAKIAPIAVVDHHERQEQLPDAEFVDIRRVGATATIYSEYIQAGLLNLDRNRREHVVLSTALMHGLFTDTSQFIRATEEDFLASAFLSRYYDAGILLEIVSQARSRQTMDVIQLALQNRVTRGSFSIAGIGYVRAEERDAIPQAADFLLTEENIHTAIVYGIVLAERDGQRSESVVGSLRTSKLTLDPDAFLKDVFGRGDSGQFFGGGKAEAGGFEIPIGFLTGGASEEYQSLKWQVYDTQIKQRLFAKIGVKE